MKHLSILIVMALSCLLSASLTSCKEETVSSVLVVIDVQRDFFSPEGSLYVKGGEELPKKIAEVIGSYDAVIFTLDWHPGNHCSFAENGGIWPSHCVNFTQGAGLADEFSPYLKEGQENTQLFFKGTDPEKEQYGAFEEVNEKIANWFKSAEKIAICGIAGDYCVKESAANILKYAPSEKCVILTELIASIDDGTALRQFIEENSLKTE